MTRRGEDSTGRSFVTARGANVTLAWAGATDVGHRRAVNEDSLVLVPPVFAVADGMGGHSAGDRASSAVVERLGVLADVVGESAIGDALTLAANDIDALSVDMPLGAGTTVTGAVLDLSGERPAFLVFNVGDSRVYSFIRNELLQVTRDHSVVQELVDAGIIEPHEAEAHPESNVITRALGFREDPNPDFWRIPLVAGMRLLLCSDGLTKELDAARIRLHMAARLTAGETANALVDAALAAGGRDNITVIVIDVTSVDGTQWGADGPDYDEGSTGARG
ncbi:PP2C family serine/threonine-protein phosphatase [Salinibacterium sp. ZJ70]|uniref:PP2C family protein-serine/threonine phosphatase n=1 Tax=Salinibacterium sp. ZJ70 TaxID=2708084 RepID=UPI00141EAD85|nr:protein phosphatase 2C domain-containing protein [Salinibacterium sp. ZJ70]